TRIGGTGSSMLGTPRPERRSVSRRGSKNQPVTRSMSREASSISSSRRASLASATVTPSARRSATEAYTSLPLALAAPGGVVVLRGRRRRGGLRRHLLVGHRRARGHGLQVVRGAALDLRGLALARAERLGLGLGADVERERRVLVRGHLAHG